MWPKGTGGGEKVGKRGRALIGEAAAVSERKRIEDAGAHHLHIPATPDTFEVMRMLAEAAHLEEIGCTA
jgi:hypothetical protein